MQTKASRAAELIVARSAQETIGNGARRCRAAGRDRGGHDPGRIEDLWQRLTDGSFYRSGPILASAVSGIDQALWDILGKRLQTPIHQLLGGAVRDRVRVYGWIGGDEPDGVRESAQAAKEHRLSGLAKVGMGVWRGLGPHRDQRNVVGNHVVQVAGQGGALSSAAVEPGLFLGGETGPLAGGDHDVDQPRAEHESRREAKHEQLVGGCVPPTMPAKGMLNSSTRAARLAIKVMASLGRVTATPMHTQVAIMRRISSSWLSSWKSRNNWSP